MPGSICHFVIASGFMHLHTTCSKVQPYLQKVAWHPASLPAGKVLKALVSRVLDRAPAATRRAVAVVAQTFSNAADYDKILKVCTGHLCRQTMQLVRRPLCNDAVPLPAYCEACTALGLHSLARAFCLQELSLL